MEVNKENPVWLNESHPNYVRWKRSRDISIERGKFVQSIVRNKINTKNLTVLDLGSGEGATAKVFSENNFVVSVDLSLIRLQRQKGMVIPSNFKKPIGLKNYDIRHFDQRDKSESITGEDFSLKNSSEMTNKNILHSIERVNGSALQLPFTNHSFDLIIVQDVIEHLADVKDFYSEVKRVLKKNGTIYLSTPNKLSVFNFLSDPHFGLPIISMLKRESIKEYFLKYLRKEDYHRKDIAQLLSLSEILFLFQNEFEITLYTKFSVKELFNGNKGIIWSDFHLRLITLSRFLIINWLISKIANDKFGVINKYFTPTFYLILKRASH